MATAPVNTGNRNTATVLPKRGKIRAQIYGNIKETVTSAATKAGEALITIIKKGGGGGNRPGSASTSPPDSAYPSDGFNDHD